MLPLLYTVPAAIGAAQAVASAIPTKAELQNNKALKELETKKKTGTLGLEDDERRLMQSALTDPVRRAVTQLGTAQPAAPSGDMAAQQAARTATARALGGAASDAAMKVEQASMDKARQQEQELNQRLAVASQYGKDRIDALSNAASTTAAVMGEFGGDVPLMSIGGFGGAASNSGEGATQAMQAMGATAEEINQYLRVARSNPRMAREMLTNFTLKYANQQGGA